MRLGPFASVRLRPILLKKMGLWLAFYLCKSMKNNELFFLCSLQFPRLFLTFVIVIFFTKDRHFWRFCSYFPPVCIER